MPLLRKKFFGKNGSQVARGVKAEVSLGAVGGLFEFRQLRLMGRFGVGRSNCGSDELVGSPFSPELLLAHGRQDRVDGKDSLGSVVGG